VTPRPLVAGIDSSTQSCKVVVCDAQTGALVRHGRAPHPRGTEVDPEEWWQALQRALDAAGGLDGVGAVSVAAQQHGLVSLDAEGHVVRPALLWNDLRAAPAAADLRAELGARTWAEAVGSVPLASFTVSKLRWLAEHEPRHSARVAAVCLPHDWLTWRLRGSGDVEDLTTDRGDASGTGYWSPATGGYRTDLLEHAFGRVPLLPRVLGPTSPAGSADGAVVGPGTGDNMAAALGVGAEPGDLVVSIGTSGVVSAVRDEPSADPGGTVAGFADATGRYLPLACTLNAATVLDSTARMLAVSRTEFDDLACAAPAGSDGLVCVPYFDGERTPNLPLASGALFGLRHQNLRPGPLARAAVEGIVCNLALAALVLGTAGRVLVVGGGAASRAVQEVAPTAFGGRVFIPRPQEHVANGAARQAAWVLRPDHPPPTSFVPPGEWREARTEPGMLERYRSAAAAVNAMPTSALE